jgi:hypothetical protein
VSMLFELAVLLATLTGLLSGSCSIYWVKVKPTSRHARWGRRLFILTLLALGTVALAAALMRADGLGMLIVGMLWENPVAAAEDSSPM